MVAWGRVNRMYEIGAIVSLRLARGEGIVARMRQISERWRLALSASRERRIRDIARKGLSAID